MSERLRRALVALIVLSSLVGASAEARAASVERRHEWALTFGVGALAIQQREAQVGFTLEGVGPQGAPLEVDRQSARRPLAAALMLGAQARLWGKLALAIRLTPMLSSFASNAGKNDRVYGAAVHLSVGYLHELERWRLGVMLELGHVFGGYGITSFGRQGQPYVEVEGTRFYDDDIGVHLIDRAWQLGPSLVVERQLSARWGLRATLGWHGLLARRAEVNIAGFIAEDGPVEWKRKPLTDEDLSLRLDGRRVRDASALHYRFEGPTLTVGATWRF